MENLEKGMTAEDAATNVLQRMLDKFEGRGGMIVAKQGEVGFAFSTNRMAWAVATEDGLVHSGIDPEK